MELTEIEATVQQLLTHFRVQSLTTKHVIDAFRIVKRYQFSFWDSLIVAAALDMQCSVLYTEDLHHGQWIDNTLEIRNPFVEKKS
jgi:predicted nucleic acid-binding protein